MATYNSIKYRIRSELSEVSEITFSDEEMFLYTCEAGNMLHGMIATINPSFLLTGYKTYSKMNDYLPYEQMRWYSDFNEAAMLSAANDTNPDFELPEEYRYLDINMDGYVTTADFNAILGMDVYDIDSNGMYDWLRSNHKLDSIDFSQIAIPSNCMFLYNLYFTDYSSEHTFKLALTNLDNVIYHQSSVGMPAMYTRVGNYIKMAPSISEPSLLQLYYVPSYTPPVDEFGDLGVPDAFVPFVVEYAVLRAHNRNDRKTLVEQSFLNQKGELIQSILGREETHIQVIPTLTNNPYRNVR